MILILFFFLTSVAANDYCTDVNHCNGNGFCNATFMRCECYEGFGSYDEIKSRMLISNISPLCSQRTCPAHGAWAGDFWAFNHKSNPLNGKLKECSDMGHCNRVTGKCECFNGFRGSACEKKGCDSTVNDELCSRIGDCLSLYELSMHPEAQPLRDLAVNSKPYANDESLGIWEADMLFGCVCYSSWEVGLEAGQKQVAEYFGPDCSLRRCPSGNDPMTEEDETDCENKKQDNSLLTIEDVPGFGRPGNLCHVECSNRGLCNFKTGECNCFTGYTGNACQRQDSLAVGL